MALDPLTAVLDIGSKVIDRLWPDPATRDAAKLELFKAQQAGDLEEARQVFELAKGQQDINKQEAASISVFVAGWRPFVGWVCGVAFAYAAIGEPMARFVATVFYHYTGTFPQIDTALTMQTLFGLLGLGAMRSWEKGKGVATK